jgi:hypothetical protein
LAGTGSLVAPTSSEDRSSDDCSLQAQIRIALRVSSWAATPPAGQEQQKRL